MEKGLVLGLDGVDYDFLLANRDELPTFDGVFADGCYGRCRSTIPPATAAAWSAGLSGMNPARTGVTDFESDDEAGEGDVISSTDVRAPRIWDVAEDRGRTAAAVGVPVSYPATSLDGLMVSGFLSPDEPGRFHPPEVADSLPEDYDFFIKYSEYGPDKSDVLLERIHASIDAKFDFLHDVLRGDVPGSEDVNTVCFVLQETDIAQHYFRTQPTDDDYERGEDVILEILKHVDERVAETLEVAADWNVGFLSDHGFGKTPEKYVYLNQWLIDEGYLVLGDGGDGRDGGAAESGSLGLQHRLGQHVRSLMQIPGSQYVKRLAPSSVTDRVATLQEIAESNVDWDRTKATFTQVFYNVGNVTVNRDAVDDRDALVTELIEALNALEDPQTGQPVIADVYRREELYSGPFLEEVPDVVFVYHDAYTGREELADSVVRTLPPEKRPAPSHKMEGFYCFVGDRFEPGNEDIQITDFAPTMYAALDLPLPHETDGSVVESALASPDPSTAEYGTNPLYGDTGTATDEARDRLEELGYL